MVTPECGTELQAIPNHLQTESDLVAN
jgi:hypothetical protein